MNRLLLSVIAGTLALTSSGCWGVGLSHEQQLTGGYALWAVDSKEDMSLVKITTGQRGATGVVNPTVFAAGWNDDFILVKQHPNHDKTRTAFFILQVKDGKLLGPLSIEAFGTERKNSGVPASLDFTLVFEDLK